MLNVFCNMSGYTNHTLKWKGFGASKLISVKTEKRCFIKELIGSDFFFFFMFSNILNSNLFFALIFSEKYSTAITVVRNRLYVQGILLCAIHLMYLSNQKKIKNKNKRKKKNK